MGDHQDMEYGPISDKCANQKRKNSNKRCTIFKDSPMKLEKQQHSQQNLQKLLFLSSLGNNGKSS